MKPRTYEYEQILEHDGMMLQASLYQWLMLPAALVLAASVSHAEDDPHRVYPESILLRAGEVTR